MSFDDQQRTMEPETYAALERARDQIIENWMFGDPNITGAGIGFRRRSGEYIDEPVVTVFVARKRPQALVPRTRLLPRSVTVDGRRWGADVMETGRMEAFATAAPRA